MDIRTFVSDRITATALVRRDRLVIAASLFVALAILTAIASGRSPHIGATSIAHATGIAGEARPPGARVELPGFEEVIALPVGTGAGELGIMSGQETEAWGPAAFAIDDEGRFHVLDGVNRRTVIAHPSGGHTREIIWKEPLVCPVDIAIASARTFLLDLAAQPAAVREVGPSGDTVRSWEIPPTYLDHGVTGLSVSLKRDGDPDVRIDLAGAWQVSLSRTGVGTDVALPAVLSEGVMVIPASAASEFGITRGRGAGSFVTQKDWKSERSAQITMLSRNRKQAAYVVKSESPIGAVRVVDTDADGNVYVFAEHLEGDAEQVRAYVKRYSSDGEPRARFELPVSSYATHPFRSITIAQDGSAYLLVPGPSQVVIARALWMPDAGELLPREERSPEVLTTSTEQHARVGCIVDIVRETVASLFSPDEAVAAWTPLNANDRAWAYIDHQWFCSANNHATRNGSIRPRYITAANRSYRAVPYCWGGFDTVTSFNTAMSSGLSAGDINCTGTKRSGTAGVDCSGFVSRLWGLGTKRSTYTLRDIARQVSKTSMNLGDAYIWPGSHCMFFRYYTTGGAQVFESTKTNSYDRVVTMNRTNTALANYTAWRYQNW